MLVLRRAPSGRSGGLTPGIEAESGSMAREVPMVRVCLGAHAPFFPEGRQSFVVWLWNPKSGGLGLG